MKAENTYFGIQFPPNSSLSEEESRKLAKLLFLSPSTSAKEAQRILANPKLTSVIQLLISNLSCELESITSATAEERMTSDRDADDDDGDEVNSVSLSWMDLGKIINDKLTDWVRVFCLPSEDEIIEASTDLKVPGAEKWIKTLRKVKLTQLDSPVKIADYLSQFVAGQPEAIRNISMIVHDHKIRRNSAHELPKTSCLLIGDSGTGKSYLINKAREIIDAPMLRVNCGELVPAGIVGYTITKAMTDLHLLGGSEISQTEQGVLHFDEFDKLAKYNHNNDDHWKTTTQFEMLKFFDRDEKIVFPGSFEQFARTLQISTNNLMLVFSGAFQGIDAIIYSRLITEFDGNSKLIDKDNLLQYCSGDDIQKYGIIPELAGRLSFICPLKKLNSSDIYTILTNVRDSDISKHLKKCEMLGIHVRFTDEALRCISQKVADQNLGARFINTILTQILKDVYFNAHHYKEGEFRVDAKKVLLACNSNRYMMLFRAFDNNTDLHAIAEQFEIKIDNLLDIYLEYKSLKNGGQNYVI